MTEVFTKEEFEKALPQHNVTGAPLWTYKGLLQGEYAYTIALPHCVIVIRSSVRGDGYAADTGKDSIRAWITEPNSTKPLAKKTQKYVTRVRGWQGRMKNMLRQLYKIGLKIKPCPKCGQALRFVDIKNGQNAGKTALTCTAQKDGKFLNHVFEVLPEEE